jgi:hypothetical protein
MVKGKDKITCSSCGSEKDQAQFYMSSSPFHKATNRYHVCKVCLQDYLKDDLRKFTSLIRMLDKPFVTHLYESAQKQNNVLGDYRELTWDDSDFEGHKRSQVIKANMSEDLEIDEENLSKDELKELINFFGKGFETDDYIWLKNEYEDFLNRYECDSKGMELLIKEICLQQLDIKNRRGQGEKVDQQLKTLQDLLGSSNLKPVQETGANAVEQESFGTLIKKFEREKPIPEPDPIWKDVDGIGKYIRTFFFGHMARAIGAENKFQDEYDEEINKFTISQDEIEDDE